MRNKLLAMFLLSLSSCSSGDLDSSSSVDHIDGTYIYEDIDDPSRPSALSIVFDPKYNAFRMYQIKHANYRIREYTDRGGIFKIQSNDEYMFSRSIQILIPKNMSSNRATRLW